MSSAEQATQVPATASPQQQQPQQTQQPVAAGAPSQSSSSVDNGLCIWDGSCYQRLQTPEQLYDHICEQHIGRKSTNNLNLTCGWGNCHITLQKRDHITSHIRVHVPLKPHRCTFCGKQFKRPQDLKKHVKTHADDSGNVRSANPAGGNGHHPNGGYNIGNQHRDLIANMQHTTAPGFYAQNPSQPNVQMSYGHQGHNGGPGYYAPTQPSNSSYPFVSYNQGGHVGNRTAFDIQAREQMNNFFGDVKGGTFNPNDYGQVAHQLASISNLQPAILDYGGTMVIANGGMPNDHSVPKMVSMKQNQIGSYGPNSWNDFTSMSNLKSRDDLRRISQKINVMVDTSYKNSPRDTFDAGDIAQSVSVYGNGLTLRHSHSPPGQRLAPTHQTGISGPSMGRASSRSNHSATPVLTPSSSAVSNSPSCSPDSHHSNSRSPNGNGSMYPNLPETASASTSNAYLSANVAPISVLSTEFDNDLRRRRNGGKLQSARPMLTVDHKGDLNTSEDRVLVAKNALFSTRSGGQDIFKTQDCHTLAVEDSMIDPALSGITSPSTSVSDTASDKNYQLWGENARILEKLKEIIDSLLAERDYENDNETEEEDAEELPKVEGMTNLYPSLPEMGTVN